ncbi:MAG: 4Fe-4S dicluster domain-containing protein [candidate division FCPU426 bacterium]
MTQQTVVVQIDEDACTGCGKCVDLCPKKILYLDPETGKCRVTDDQLCDRLAGCERVCPTAAIHINK